MLNLEVTFQLYWPKKKNKRNKQNKKHSDTVKEEIDCSKEPGWTNFIHQTLIGANVYEIRLGFFEISRWLCLRHTFFICFRKSLLFFLFFFSFSLHRWVSSTTLLKRLMCWKDWTLTQSTGKEREGPVLESSSKSSLVMNPGRCWTYLFACGNYRCLNHMLEFQVFWHYFLMWPLQLALVEDSLTIGCLHTAFKFVFLWTNLPTIVSRHDAFS